MQGQSEERPPDRIDADVQPGVEPQLWRQRQAHLGRCYGRPQLLRRLPQSEVRK